MANFLYLVTAAEGAAAAVILGGHPFERRLALQRLARDRGARAAGGLFLSFEDKHST